MKCTTKSKNKKIKIEELSDWPGATVHAEECSCLLQRQEKMLLGESWSAWPPSVAHYPHPSPASRVIGPEGLEGTSLPIQFNNHL